VIRCAKACCGPTCHRELSRRLLGLGTPPVAHHPTAAEKTQTGPPHGAEEKTMGHHPDRNTQFENIARLRREYEAVAMR